MRTLSLPWSEDDPAVVDKLGDHDPQVHTYRHDGVCQVAGCGSRLSMYNDGDVCAAHSFARHIPIPVKRRAHGGAR